MTTDIDVVIQGDTVPVRSLVAALRRHRIVPRIDDDDDASLAGTQISDSRQAR